ncbi:MAG: hypothetical protein MK086_11915 [Flavobacteriales bacterium]|nr:hypothetical protein [Flavobacteriales bacterium]
MTEKESLEIIINMIDRTKENLKEQSGFYLIWGGSIFLAALVEYVLFVFYAYPHHYIVWPVSILIAVAATIFMATKMNRKKQVRTYTDKALNYLWATWSAMLFLVLVFSAVGGISWATSYVLIIALYGMGTLISGGILNFRPLIIGGMISLAIALVSIITGWFSDFPSMLLALCASISASFLVPGYLLRKS